MNASMLRAGRPAGLACLLLILSLAAPALAQRDPAPRARAAQEGWLGVVLQDVTSSMAGALGLEEAAGVLVASVQEGSPAAKAGLREGDVILRFDRRRVEDSGELADLVGRTEPGERARLEIVRDGERQDLTVEIAARPAQEDLMVLRKRMDRDTVRDLRRGREDDTAGQAHRRALELFKQRGAGGWLGVQLQDLNEQLGEYFGVEDGEGALVQEVVEDSPAAEAGLEAGDVIVRLGGESVESAADVTRKMAGTKPGERLELQVMRDRSLRTFEVTLGERQGMPEMFDLGQLPRGKQMPDQVYRLPDLQDREAPRAFWFQSDEGALREDVDQLREELRELRRELRDLQQEFESRQGRR